MISMFISSKSCSEMQSWKNAAGKRGKLPVSGRLAPPAVRQEVLQATSHRTHRCFNVSCEPFLDTSKRLRLMKYIKRNRGRTDPPLQTVGGATHPGACPPGWRCTARRGSGRCSPPPSARSCPAGGTWAPARRWSAGAACR